MNINFVKDIFRNNEELDPLVYKEFFAKQLILRDYLAIERTILTNEATFLAYIRTSLTIIVVGVTVFKLSLGNATFQNLGVVLTVVGILIMIIGSTRTIQMRNKINKFLEKRTEVDPMSQSLR